MRSDREFMEYDVVIVGAGPAGLAAACRLKQKSPDLSVVVVEKGAEVGAHILSGAVFEPSALQELFPDWKERGAPLHTEVKRDEIYLMLNAEKAIQVPGPFAPKTMHNHGNYIVSMGLVCRWLAEQAEQLGVEIFPGFAATEVLYDEDGAVKGIATGDMGLDATGKPKTGFTAGMELHGKYTLFAEGCRGMLGKQLIQKYQLDSGKDPQHYGIGIKEIWEISEDKHEPGLVIHSAGWPLTESGSAGGGFLYHADNRQVFLGLIVDLSYKNPYVSPFDEMQRFKTHPTVRKFLEGGKRTVYGARAITKGGLQSQPVMHFPGGLLIGDNAGTLNFAKIKGNHTAMKSGMIAADVVADAIEKSQSRNDLVEFNTAYRESSAYRELYLQRNFGPAQHKLGNILGSAYAFIDINLFNGKLPWTLHDQTPDYLQLQPAVSCQKINYPKPDGVLTFDKLSSVFLSNTNHEEDQPCHLKLANPDIPISKNLPMYDEPAQRYCPAGVYEVITLENGAKRFQINGQNCVHCKTCDIKDPAQNITWVCPEGSGGPTYPNM